MLFLDMKSFFTSVFIQGVLDCLVKRFRECHYSTTEIEKTFDFVHFCVRETALVFNDDFRTQIESLGMESSLSPLLCDIYILDFEDKHFSIHTFPHWLRYTDDTFVLAPTNSSSFFFFSSLSSIYFYFLFFHTFSHYFII